MLTAEGRIFTWGRGSFGRLGTGVEKDCYSPVEVFLPGAHAALPWASATVLPVTVSIIVSISFIQRVSAAHQCSVSVSMFSGMSLCQLGKQRRCGSAASCPVNSPLSFAH